MQHKIDYQTRTKPNRITPTSDNHHYVAFYLAISGEYCMNDSVVACQNLGPKEIRKRRLLGYLALNIGLVLAIVFIWQDAPDYLRVLVFVPFFVGYLGILQSIQKTCVVLAFKGTKNQDQGEELIVEDALRRKLWRRSIWILILAGLLALICTYLSLAIHTELLRWLQPPDLPG